MVGPLRRRQRAEGDRSWSPSVRTVGANDRETSAFEHGVLRHLAAGRVADVHAALPVAGRGDLFATLAGADARLRRSTVALAELQRIEVRVERAGPAPGPYRMWIKALLAGRLLQDFDLHAGEVARSAVMEVPTEPLVPPVDLYARGRLRAVAALTALMVPTPASIVAHHRWRDAAITDFLRGGLTEEAAGTSAVSAGMAALYWGENIDANLQTLLRTGALLGENESSTWGGVLDPLLAAVALGCGDLRRVEVSLGRIEDRDADRPVGSRSRLAPLLHAFLDLVATKGSPGAATLLDQELRTAGHGSLRLTQIFHVMAGHVLADFGQPTMRRFADAARDLPHRTPCGRRSSPCCNCGRRPSPVTLRQRRR